MQRDPGGVWALCKDEQRRFEDLGNHFEFFSNGKPAYGPLTRKIYLKQLRSFD
jgi:hypothetical protein